MRRMGALGAFVVVDYCDLMVYSYQSWIPQQG